MKHYALRRTLTSYNVTNNNLILKTTKIDLRIKPNIIVTQAEGNHDFKQFNAIVEYIFN